MSPSFVGAYRLSTPFVLGPPRLLSAGADEPVRRVIRQAKGGDLVSRAITACVGLFDIRGLTSRLPRHPAVVSLSFSCGALETHTRPPRGEPWKRRETANGVLRTQVSCLLSSSTLALFLVCTHCQCYRDHPLLLLSGESVCN